MSMTEKKIPHLTAESIAAQATAKFKFEGMFKGTFYVTTRRQREIIQQVLFNALTRLTLPKEIVAMLKRGNDETTSFIGQFQQVTKQFNIAFGYGLRMTGLCALIYKSLRFDYLSFRVGRATSHNRRYHCTHNDINAAQLDYKAVAIMAYASYIEQCDGPALKALFDQLNDFTNPATKQLRKERGFHRLFGSEGNTKTWQSIMNMVKARAASLNDIDSSQDIEDIHTSRLPSCF